MKKILLILLCIPLIVLGQEIDEFCEGDCKNGYGTYFYDNNWMYKGEFKDSKFHGQGTYVFYGGDLGCFSWSYKGEWINGKRNGQGTYSHALGHKYVGEFKDNKVNGEGIYTYANGDYDVVWFENDEAIYVKCFDNNGKEIECREDNIGMYEWMIELIK